MFYKNNGMSSITRDKKFWGGYEVFANVQNKKLQNKQTATGTRPACCWMAKGGLYPWE